MRSSAPAPPPQFPRLCVWQWALLVLLAPFVIAFFAVRFLVGLFIAPPLPAADDGGKPETTPRPARGSRAEPTAVGAIEPSAEAADAKPVAVAASCALRVDFPAVRRVSCGSGTGSAPARFRGS